MGFWSWIFGENKKTKSDTDKKSFIVDTRDYLLLDEEWATPEEWFVDTDGKKIKKKKNSLREPSFYNDDLMSSSEILIVDYVLKSSSNEFNSTSSSNNVVDLNNSQY